MALNGSLDDYSPAGALRVLSSTGRTGAVRFTGSAGCTAYLCEGQLYFVRGGGTDDALASALVRPGRLSPELWTRAVEEAGDSPRVGELLIAHGSIEPDLLASVVLSMVYDPLITLFREGDGRFDFEPDTMHWIGPYRGFDVEAIVNEVRRRVRGVDEMSDIVPSVSAWVSPRRALPDGAAQVTLLREDWELITSLSGPRTITELAASMGRGQYSTAGVVHRLARAELLEVVPEPFSPHGGDPVHEPSAAERIAAATTGPDERTDDAISAGTGDAGTGTDDATEVEDAPDEAWEQWSTGNPFDHDPSAGNDDLGVTSGPSLNGVSAGPETAPDGDSRLPRRTSVREADPRDRPAGATVDHDADADADADSGGLVGITGFHDPVADVHRESSARAEAIEPESPLDPNAAWLEGLYTQFIDESADTGKTRKKEVLDVAFQAPEQGDGEKAGTLRRLVDALRRL
ncbi:DUF4388 domain-containing protein [Iamia sp.]|uniref:DUF4388 domain-containing protein n=1 Tax=Iamia sp. TaxID=2722710 RepID=UPI002C7FEF46|nr:DUF4388 domain-containing protein [Iamia sp.]HXH55831.1 DUF4388 domain-containing protein [Iamia sp.]